MGDIAASYAGFTGIFTLAMRHVFRVFVLCRYDCSLQVPLKHMQFARAITSFTGLEGHTLRSVALPPAWRSEAASFVLIFLSRSDMPCTGEGQALWCYNHRCKP